MITRYFQNITLSRTWKKSQIIRYGADSIINKHGIHFLKDFKNNTLFCLAYFDFDVTNELIDYMSELIIQDGIDIVFKYLDEDSRAYKSIMRNHYSTKGGELICRQVLDRWNSPFVRIDSNLSFRDYLSGRHKRLQRTFRKIDKLMNEGIFYDLEGNEDNILSLWLDVLKIDSSSWKRKMNSDMRSLDREDLQYIFPLLMSQENNSLLVTYENNIPQAYSLMMRRNINTKWFAVKWGCSYEGRNKFLGIVCLLNHLQRLHTRNKVTKSRANLEIDLWGRRSQIYDQFATHFISRCHIKLTSIASKSN